MGTITVLDYTTKEPLEMIGRCAGVCWGANLDNKKKNISRARSCLSSGHMRVAEFPDVYLIIDGYSARVIRELYVHIGSLPTRLQASTRYIDYEHSFDYIIPHTINNNPEAKKIYLAAMKNTADSLNLLNVLGIPREDSANLLPLGMTTKMVLRMNFRNLIEMSHQRLCARAYWEFRELFKDLSDALSNYSEEWAELVKEYFKPKCEVMGFCTEEKCCGRKEKKSL